MLLAEKPSVGRNKLNADMRQLNGEYVLLKNSTAAVEKIRSNAYGIVRDERRRAQDMEL